MTHEDLVAADLRDLEINTNRQVTIGGGGDLRQTHGLRTVKQSTILSVGNQIRPLIGDPITPKVLADIEARITDALSNDPQLESVRRVAVDTINKQTNTIVVEVFVGFNNSFTLDLVLP